MGRLEQPHRQRRRIQLARAPRHSRRSAKQERLFEELTKYMAGKYVDSPSSRKARAGLSLFLWSVAVFILNLESLASIIKSAAIENHLMVALMFVILLGPTLAFSVWSYKSNSEFLWEKSKDWTLYLLLTSIPLSYGLIILKFKHLI
jgi:hypothetical protein